MKIHWSRRKLPPLSEAPSTVLKACAAQAYPEVAPPSMIPGVINPSWEELIRQAEEREREQR